MVELLQNQEPFSWTGKVASPFAAPFAKMTARAAEKLSGLDKLSSLHEQLRPESGESIYASVERLLDLGCVVEQSDLDRIPAKGPLVIVANHPFGGAEGIVLARAIATKRNDVRVLANYLLGRIPELRESLILVDPFLPGASRANVRGLRQALQHLKNGGALVAFPAGAVSHFQVEQMRIADPEWHPAIARLVRATAATVLPIYFPGANGPLFQLAGMIHPSLRTALLPKALLQRQHTRIEMRIGRPIPFRRIEQITDPELLIRSLRSRTYVLARRRSHELKNEPVASRREPIRHPVPQELLRTDIAALGEEHRLVTSGEMDVFIARATEVPHVLAEIGRLRETTFRAVGEGTGRSSDVDAFDMFYRHLFIWNREKQEIVGAYRLGLVDEIVERYGVGGLYTSTLFRFRPQFFERIGRNSIEMGRSFVRIEYQRAYAPLLLLWRGISTFAYRNPRYRVLFGPASISNDYNGSSRALLAHYLLHNVADRELTSHVQARSSFRPRNERHELTIEGFDDLQETLLDIECGQRGVPVLLRQYLNVGGRVAALNVDRQFSDVLDALVVVDLARMERKTLARFMGNEEATVFQRMHTSAA